MFNLKNFFFYTKEEKEQKRLLKETNNILKEQGRIQFEKDFIKDLKEVFNEFVDKYILIDCGKNEVKFVQFKGIDNDPKEGIIMYWHYYENELWYRGYRIIRVDTPPYLIEKNYEYIKESRLNFIKFKQSVQAFNLSLTSLDGNEYKL